MEEKKCNFLQVKTLTCEILTDYAIFRYFQNVHGFLTVMWIDVLRFGTVIWIFVIASG